MPEKEKKEKLIDKIDSYLNNLVSERVLNRYVGIVFLFVDDDLKKKDRPLDVDIYTTENIQLPGKNCILEVDEFEEKLNIIEKNTHRKIKSMDNTFFLYTYRKKPSADLNLITSDRLRLVKAINEILKFRNRIINSP